ncbi:type II secretion system protein, partial [Candidatus Saccharibacteria bacterium]|nr:type II secretion system protein [Candidatus Saccharibacteria bacterium]
MGIHAKHGFTIIETMLVLAITGMLIAALLVGVGSSISTQRYRDSVLTFKSLLQDQYAQIDNVSNDRDASWSCGSSAQPIQSGPGVAPGQSDCVLIGRYVGIVDGDISVATIVGYETSSAPGATDVEEIKNNYTLGVSTSSIERKTLEWGSVIAWPA